MAFVPEDGTGMLGANSLVSIEYADEYFADRADTVWSALDQTQKQAALIAGTTYANTQYKYRGLPLTPGQGTAFPRIGITDPNGLEVKGIPICIKAVVCELAKRASQGPLIQDPVIDEGGRPVKMKSLRAGPLIKTVEFAGPGEVFELGRFPAVDALMCPWLIFKEVKYANGVKVAGAQIEGVSNSRMGAASQEVDRYSGPINENGKDVVIDDGNVSF